MPKKNQGDVPDEYHEFIQFVAQQQKDFASITGAAELLEMPDLPAEHARTRISFVENKWRKISDRDVLMEPYEALPSCSTHEYFAQDFLGTAEEMFLNTVGSLSMVVNQGSSSPSTPTATTPSAATHECTRRRTQVPTPKLPRFSGNLLNWVEFRDHFQALIINDPSFDNFKRLYYLKSCLEGDAAALLKTIAITSENYEIAWKLVVERYENKRRLLSMQLNSLYSLKFITHDGSPSDLRNLIDSVQESKDALAKLGRPVSDDILVHLITQRLDRGTREAWEFSLEGDDFATYDQMMKFLKLKVRALEASTPTIKASRPVTSQPRAKTNSISPLAIHHANSRVHEKCILCDNAHSLFKCTVFNGKSVSQRWDLVRQHSLCVNCLSMYHKVEACRSERTRLHCKRRHHSLLHAQPRKVANAEAAASTSNSAAPEVDANLIQSHLSTPQMAAYTILATAWVLVTAVSGRVVKLRALLDQGSTHTFISRTTANELRTKTYAASMQVNGIGRNQSASIAKVLPISVSSVTNTQVALTTDALILDELTSYVPKFRLPLTHWSHLDGLEFADGNPTDCTPIHLIIGADLYAYALRDGMIRGRRDEPVALNTIFGWVLSGTSNTAIDSSDGPSVQVHHLHLPDDDLTSTLKRFWVVEEVSPDPPVSEEDAQCERHFKETHSRTDDGRYVVRIPLRNPITTELGDTYRRAEQCLYSLERRLVSRPDERAAYVEFMQEYESLGHMRVASPQKVDHPTVYIPHHPVVKATSTTTITRVVFNASAISTTGISLNDLQLTGPKLQANLALLHLQWRLYRYVYTADVEKMFRQIEIDPRDIDLQRILFRPILFEAVLEFQLLTVTYGTTSAPFLALRVLQQLAEDEGDAFPLGREVILRRRFVDDVMFGANTIKEAIAARDQTNALLSKGHFLLRKWSSNSAALLADIDPANHGLACDKLLQEDDSVKVLGIAWRPASDSYSFTLNISLVPINTKRAIMSQIARIFDPLGWLAPVVVVAKHLIQLLWSSKTPWDSPLPTDLQFAWDTFYDALPSLSAISIPRWLDTSPSSRVEIHGFSDASMKAYAAVVYVRVELPSGEINVHLLTAKTRVAPLKQLSVPRLKLCGAVILALLIHHVRSVPIFAAYLVTCWTDSTIVLAWLKGQSNEWRTFVANRVAEVHSVIPEVAWRHVPGVDNPADLASRGMSASLIALSDLWWHGPSWLSADPSSWPSLDPVVSDDVPLERKVNVCHAEVKTDVAQQLVARFSSWPRMCRVLAYCLHPSARWKASVSGQSRVAELTLVANRVFALTQATVFNQEITLLKNNPKTPDGSRHLQTNQRLNKKSRLRRLNPFLDANGLLRVGGRLSLSKLSYAAKFPIILPYGHVALLLARHAHERCLHGGITLTLSTLRTHVWVLQACKLIKSVVKHCIPCARQLAEVPIQMMRSLPPARINRPPRAFFECGVDYAGPFRLRLISGRGSKSHPTYIALFICMALSAVHLEVVSDYSSNAFLAAFQGFMSRRGLPHTMHSDCGTTFVGADKELRAAYRAAVQDDKLRARVAEDGVEWRFIPLRAPHFGGLWEAGVRSMKRHLKRVLDPHTPTFEELTTLACRIEACMNSRPLAPLHDDIESLDTLTPAHFLVGGPLTVAAAPFTVNFSMSRSARWQLYSQLLDNFWTRWSRDYVTSCQHRSKWFNAQTPIAVGQLVLMRDDNFPPAKWDLARVIECFPGHDGLTRVVKVRTATSVYTRPISKLAMLPVAIEGDTLPTLTH